MVKTLLVLATLASLSVPSPTTSAELQPMACPTEQDLFDLLNAADREDGVETTRLARDVCHTLVGARYEVEGAANGVTRIRLFPREGDWAHSRPAYTLDEMVLHY